MAGVVREEGHGFQWFKVRKFWDFETYFVEKVGKEV